MLIKGRKQDNVIRFHVRHSVYMLIVFAVLVTAFVLLLSKHYSLNIEHENRLLSSRFLEEVQDLDNLLASVTTRVEGMRMHAEFDYLEIRLTEHISPPLPYHFLKEADNDSRFHLDDFRAPITRNQIGNLTGKGSLRQRDPDFYHEIYMALRLNPRFRAISMAIRDAAWIYYTSAKEFINIYPWVPSGEFRFSRDLFNHEFFTLGTPDKNPERKLFWTEVYVDEYGKGLMTTCAAPVYDQSRFLGTVAIDLTIDFLNTRIRRFRPEKGVMLLVNDRDQLLAHPSLITSHDKKTRSLMDALPEALRKSKGAILQIPNNGALNMKNYTVFRSGLRHAPWVAYYYEFRPPVWGSFVNRIGPGALMFLTALLILVIIILFATYRNFVLPSGRLVNFIMARNKRGFADDYRDVPRIWKPWFRAVESAFRENEELTRKIRRQNEELEERVSQRTSELAASNQRLRIEIEERKQAEEEKERLQAQLQRAQKMEAIGLLAGGVAHDLNNVLAGLVSYPQLLLMELDPDSPLRDPVLTIQKSGERAAAIVQDLLTLARRGVAVTEITNVNALISEYLKGPEWKDLKFHYPGIEMSLELDRDLLNIQGSPVHLSKCIANLVTNAAEAMPRGGRMVIATENRYMDQPVSGYDEVEEGDYVTFRVTDSGIGISREDLDRIFEPFYTKKVMGRSGTGLGMAVVWGAVKDHKGYIDVQSIPGQGTTFTLFFPATREQREEGAGIDLKDYRGEGEEILIVDDVPEQREIGIRILKRLGYQPHAVSSGEEAVEYVRRHAPDLVLLDMIMDPGMDGLETYQRILAIRPGQRAVIVSGFSETDRVKEAQRLGAKAYVKKPFLLERLAVAIKNSLKE